MQQYIKRLVEKKSFELFIVIIIVLNTVILGLLASNNFSIQTIKILEIINKICIAIYVIEAIFEIYAWRLNYFRNGWNVFDFIIVSISIIPITGFFSSIRIFRLLKIFKSFTAFRLISNLKQFRKIIQAMLLSLPGIAWTTLLMIFAYFIFAIIGINLFQNNFPEQFGSFSVAFVTLFSLTTMEGWQDTVYPIVEMVPSAWFYFLTFFIIASFILLNLIVGIVVDNISKISSEEDKSSIDNSNTKVEIEKLHEKLSDIEKLLNKIIEK